MMHRPEIYNIGGRTTDDIHDFYQRGSEDKHESGGSTIESSKSSNFKIYWFRQLEIKITDDSKYSSNLFIYCFYRRMEKESSKKI